MGQNPDTYDPLPLDAPLDRVAERWRTNLDEPDVGGAHHPGVPARTRRGRGGDRRRLDRRRARPWVLRGGPGRGRGVDGGRARRTVAQQAAALPRDGRSRRWARPPTPPSCWRCSRRRPWRWTGRGVGRDRSLPGAAAERGGRPRRRPGGGGRRAGRARRVEMPFERARTQLVAGTVQRRARRRRDARTTLEAARPRSSTVDGSARCTAIEDGTPPEPSFADGRAALVLADAANESLRTGRGVRVVVALVDGLARGGRRHVVDEGRRLFRRGSAVGSGPGRHALVHRAARRRGGRVRVAGQRLHRHRGGAAGVGRAVGGVGITSMGETGILVDGHGAPVAPPSLGTTAATAPRPSNSPATSTRRASPAAPASRRPTSTR